MKYYFYVEWTWRAPVDDIGCGPFHTKLVSNNAHLAFDWRRLADLVVKQFDSETEMNAFWDEKNKE